MKPLLALFLVIAACVAPEPRVGLPWSLMKQDRGDLTGVWRQVRRNGRRVVTGYVLTIDPRLGTFALQKGCLATGGVLKPTGLGRYRIDHYETGFAAAGCPPWRRAPELAPFDSAEVSLVRDGQQLTARGAGVIIGLVRVNHG